MHLHSHCVRCGSSELIEVPSTPGDHSHIVTGNRVLQAVRITTYVCTDCGCVEQWVNGKEDLGRLHDALRQERSDPCGEKLRGEGDLNGSAATT